MDVFSRCSPLIGSFTDQSQNGMERQLETGEVIGGTVKGLDLYEGFFVLSICLSLTSGVRKGSRGIIIVGWGGWSTSQTVVT